MKLTKLLFLTLTLSQITSAAFAASALPDGADLAQGAISEREVLKRLSCSPQLISQYPTTEAERVKMTSVDYEGLSFFRSDVSQNDKEGLLTVSTIENNPKSVVILPLSSNNQIYYSADLKLMVVAGAAGSLSTGYDLYEVTNDQSLFIGSTHSSPLISAHVKGVVEKTSPYARPCRK